MPSRQSMPATSTENRCHPLGGGEVASYPFEQEKHQ